MEEGTKKVVYSDLRKREWWPKITQQFSEEECLHFEREFLEIEEQFEGVVLPTELYQLIDLVKNSLLAERCLAQQKEQNHIITHYQELIDKEFLKEPGMRDEIYIQSLNNSISAAQSALKTLGNDFRSYQQEKNSLLKALKGSRDQRIKEIEDKSESFGSLIQSLITDKQFAREVGIEAEKMRLAAIDEEVRLSAYHKYEDDKVDQPYLKSSNAKKDNSI